MPTNNTRFHRPRLTDRHIAALIEAANRHLTDDPDTHSTLPLADLVAATENLAKALR